MAVFACAGCGAELTVPVAEVALPPHAHREGGNRYLPPLLEPGTFAVDPEPNEQPWRPWSEVTAAEAAERGLYAPVDGLWSGPGGAVLLTPGDTRGTELIPERCEGCCAAADRSNLACARCGRTVGTRVDDCYRWQAVWLHPRAFRRLSVEGPARPAGDGWAVPPLPPVEPDGWWSDRWSATVGEALAEIVAASGGEPVGVAPGLLTETFGRTLQQLLPGGPPACTLRPAGPGLPAVPAPDLALVPRHPWTGAAWPAPSGTVSVPLDAEVWAYLAFPPLRPGSRLPAGEVRDDPPPLRPDRLFEPDRRLLRHRLARLPAVRQPWLRAIYDRLGGHRHHPGASEGTP
ncbi:hypothetical protein ACFVXG_18515 [Kitasatospora sp. NPDC058162]|uniref:hypothetical protein n=1 Tax=Kitasatospora sp. NPDC058162 TaxID=3346362 RepID=UPI0036DD037F